MEGRECTPGDSSGLCQKSLICWETMQHGILPYLKHLHVRFVELTQASVLHHKNEGAKRLGLPWQPCQHQGCQEIHALAVVDFLIVGCICLQYVQKSSLTLWAGKPARGSNMSQKSGHSSVEYVKCRHYMSCAWLVLLARSAPFAPGMPEGSEGVACLGVPGNVLPTSFSISEYTSALTPCSTSHLHELFIDLLTVSSDLQVL